MRAGGAKLAWVLKQLAQAVEPGINELELEATARRLIKESDARPAFLGYKPAGAKRPFPAALCLSVNNEVVHGIPSDRKLEAGDIITLDLGLEFEGFFTDMAVTVPVGRVSEEAKRLLAITEESLALGIKAARPGGTIGDIGAAVGSFATGRGYGVVRALGGHGVGYRVHEEPEVPNYGRQNSGLKLQPGLVIAIEPILTAGQGAEVKIGPDGYTVLTRDGSLAAHFEHTIAITEKGPEILTKL